MQGSLCQSLRSPRDEGREERQKEAFFRSWDDGAAAAVILTGCSTMRDSWPDRWETAIYVQIDHCEGHEDV